MLTCSSSTKSTSNWLAPGMLQVAGTTGVEEAVLTADGVVVAEDIAVFVDSDAYQPYQWALENTGDASQAGGRPGVAGADTNAQRHETSTGSGLTIAVIDTGIDLNHQDLRDRAWTNTGETCGNGIDDDNNGFIDDCNGWDFGEETTTRTPKQVLAAKHTAPTLQAWPAHPATASAPLALLPT